MINEDMLRQSAAEAAQVIRDSLPAPAECEHDYSPAFERNMRRTLRRAKHPVLYRLSRYVAGLVLGVMLAGGICMTASTEARAAFFAWVREQYEEFAVYRFVGDVPEESDAAAYELTWLPEGFSLQSEENLDDSIYRIYTDDTGRRIVFSCSQGADAAGLFVISENAEAKTVQIGSITADFYQASGEEESSVLVWFSEEGDLCFYIVSDLSEDTIIQLAENVRKK